MNQRLLAISFITPNSDNPRVLPIPTHVPHGSLLGIRWREHFVPYELSADHRSFTITNEDLPKANEPIDFIAVQPTHAQVV
jgi:hypothetical protein